MANTSPWSKISVEHEETWEWLLARDLDAIQWRIDNLEIPEIKLKSDGVVRLGDQDDIVNFLEELMKGKL